MVFTLYFIACFAIAVVAKTQNGLKGNKAQAFYDDLVSEWCLGSDQRRFPHQDSCEQYWECDEFDAIYEYWCDIATPIFDTEFLECGIEGEAICEIEFPSYPDIEDSECPLHSSEPTFLPGSYCDEYYICMNGVPHLMFCRKGQHWNMEMSYCDVPHNAGCEDGHPPSLPECEARFIGTIPHPSNCNWFIFCENGNRSIQQCQHLFHYDIDQNRCLLMSAAKCIKD